MLNVTAVHELHGIREGATADHILGVWVDHINKIDDPCIEIMRETGAIFHTLCVSLLLSLRNHI